MFTAASTAAQLPRVEVSALDEELELDAEPGEAELFESSP
jgi:hypothetical protein